MPIFLTACVVILPTLGLGFYTVHKMKPGSFRAQTSRVFSFHVEIESTGWTATRSRLTSKTRISTQKLSASARCGQRRRGLKS